MREYKFCGLLGKHSQNYWWKPNVNKFILKKSIEKNRTKYFWYFEKSILRDFQSALKYYKYFSWIWFFDINCRVIKIIDFI